MLYLLISVLCVHSKKKNLHMYVYMCVYSFALQFDGKPSSSYEYLKCHLYSPNFLFNITMILKITQIKTKQ